MQRSIGALLLHFAQKTALKTEILYTAETPVGIIRNGCDDGKRHAYTQAA
ncbi:hypothetical protein [Agrobacterium sp.]|nr:hypothetical protein [Agrobacterium sp.]